LTKWATPLRFLLVSFVSPTALICSAYIDKYCSHIHLMNVSRMTYDVPLKETLQPRVLFV
jgi:hypothetical protein